MTRPIAPANLPALVKEAFNNARQSGDLTYFPTQAAILNVGSYVFQLRFSPSLAQKPKAPPKPAGSTDKPFNPFENPPPALHVADLPPSHRLVLNKFAVVPEHFLLITRDFKQQTHVLEAEDLDAAWACVSAYRDFEDGKSNDGITGANISQGKNVEEKGEEQPISRDLFVFFNSGLHSGASQPHRHLQLLPVGCMRRGLEDVEGGHEWSVLADRVLSSSSSSSLLPFTVLTASLTTDMSPMERHVTYLDLYRRAVQIVRRQAEINDEEIPDTGEAKISYNLALTSTSMALCPRMAEGFRIRNRAGDDLGGVALNGTVLAGTALVKNEAEWDALRSNSMLLSDHMSEIGVPPSNTLAGSDT
ncbi:ATP adenylyltransferase-domain-containing protein [Xylariaceae sp. FL0255]|nr:ATP adenylyltransferase-domain-containing protein [Xylariaceae sp. FL0255]